MRCDIAVENYWRGKVRIDGPSGVVEPSFECSSKAKPLLLWVRIPPNRLWIVGTGNNRQMIGRVCVGCYDRFFEGVGVLPSGAELDQSKFGVLEMAKKVQGPDDADAMWGSLLNVYAPRPSEEPQMGQV